MSRRAASGLTARVVRDFRLAVSGGPFRVALVLSLVVHLAVLIVGAREGWWRPAGGARRSPLMRVHLIPWVSEPAAPVEFRIVP